MMQRRSDKVQPLGLGKALAALGVLALALIWGLPAAAASGPTVQHYYLLTPVSDGGLNVQERVMLNNPGPALPEGKVRFYLPGGAENVSLHGGNSLAVKDGVIGVRGQVPAGESLFEFGYMMPYTGAPHYAIQHKSDFLTDRVFIITPPQGMWVEGTGVVDRGVQQSGGTRFHLFTMEKLAPRSVVNIAAGVEEAGDAAGGVTRTPPTAFHSPGHIRFWNQSPFRGINAHLFLAIVILVPVMVVAIVISRRRAERSADGDEEDSGGEDDEEVFQRLLARERVLMEKLKGLERQHSGGEVDEETYQQLREAYKQKLVQVKIQLRSYTG